MKSLKELFARMKGPRHDEAPEESRRRLLLSPAPALLLASGVSTPLVAASLAAPASAQEAPKSRIDKILRAGTLRVGTFLQYAPYTFKNPAGEADGWDTDVAKALAADMGVKPEFIDNTWDGIIPAMQADKFDVIIAAMSNTKKRSLVIQFTHPYYMAMNAFIYRAADEQRFAKLEAFNDPKLQVSVLIQDASHLALERFFPKAQVLDFNSAAEAILAVQTNKVDCSIAELSFLTDYAKQHTGLRVKAVDFPGATSPLAMALTAGPENTHLRVFLNLWIQHFFWTGQFEPLYRKWFPDATVPGPGRFISPL